MVGDAASAGQAGASQSLKEEEVRTKVLLAAGTQSRVAGGQVHDVYGPPSKTIGHVIEGIIGTRLDGLQ